MRRRIVPIILIAIVAVAGYFAWRYYQQTSSGTSGALGGSGTIETDQIAITPQTSTSRSKRSQPRRLRTTTPELSRAMLRTGVERRASARPAMILST